MSRSCLLVVALLSGCANLSSINRTTDLPGGGKAIHLDATQRLVYSNIAGGICAEPTPDALQSYAAAMGASVGVNDRGSATLSDAFSANSASIGLHTQSITLMRDTLYRICEYSHNQQGNSVDIVQLLQRSQDLTLGALAIEQLTGAVVARQAVLSGGAHSGSSAEVRDTAAQLDAAQKNETAKKAELSAALQAEKVQKDVAANAATALATAQAGTADADTIAALTAKANAEQARLTELSAIAADAAAASTRAIAATDAIEKMYDGAMASSRAAASGTAQLSGTTGTGKITAETANVLAVATLQIVDSVLTKGHVTDACMTFLMREPTAANSVSASYKSLVTQCTNVIKVSIDHFIDRGNGPMKLTSVVLPSVDAFKPTITLSGQLDDVILLKSPEANRATATPGNKPLKKK